MRMRSASSAASEPPAALSRWRRPGGRALAFASSLPFFFVAFGGRGAATTTTAGFVVPAPPSSSSSLAAVVDVVPPAPFGVGGVRSVFRAKRTTTSSIVVVSASSSSSPTDAPSSDDAETAPPPPSSAVARAAGLPPPTTLGGAEEFEAWFRSKPGTYSSSTIRHGAFRGGRLRGLERAEDDAGGGGRMEKEAIRLPRSLVLRAPYGSGSAEGGSGDDDWDGKLSVMLLEECAKGNESELSGYCALLTRGIPYDSVPVPPSVAPDALRNWTPKQREPLKSSRSGQRLLKALERQTERWNAKYDDIRDDDRGVGGEVTRERFHWAMEAVHSRAFRGNFGLMRRGEDGDDSGVFKALATSLVPISLAAIGLNLLLNDATGENSDAIALVCALVAFSPVLVNMLAGDDADGGGDAVLLPFVDSANHLREADSKIEYDPLKDEFALSLGEKCFVEEEEENDGDGNKKTQVYISYGNKSDSELLLNYGFLPKVSFGKKSTTTEDDDEEEEEDSSRRRARLAEAFLRRNP